jgi:hypothetical protein
LAAAVLKLLDQSSRNGFHLFPMKASTLV